MPAVHSSQAQYYSPDQPHLHLPPLITRGSSAPAVCLRMLSCPSDWVDQRWPRRERGVWCGWSTHRMGRLQHAQRTSNQRGILLFSFLNQKKLAILFLHLNPFPFPFLIVFHLHFPFTLIAGHFFLHIYFSYM